MITKHTKDLQRKSHRKPQTVKQVQHLFYFVIIGTNTHHEKQVHSKFETSIGTSLNSCSDENELSFADS